MLDKEQQTIFYEMLGEKIREARKNQNLSQEDLADKLGMSRVSIVNIETGKQRLPLHVLADISELLKITVPELLPDFSNSASNSRSDQSDRINPVILNKIKKETEDSAESSEKVINYLLSLMDKKR